MKAKDYNRTDVSSASRRLAESIKENGGIKNAVQHICPLDYTVLCQLVKLYKKTYPTMSPDKCEETTKYTHPA